MINITAARDGLAELIKNGVPAGVSVQRAGFDSVATFPSVVVGMPDWQPVDDLPYGIERHTWPVAVVVSRGTGQDSSTIDQLEGLWPTVLDLLRTTSADDPTLGGICAQSIVTRAGHGPFAIQGTTYPAQLVFIDLYG